MRPGLQRLMSRGSPHNSFRSRRSRRWRYSFSASAAWSVARATGVELVTGTSTVLPHGKGSKPNDTKALGVSGMVVLWRGMYDYVLVLLACGFPIPKGHVPVQSRGRGAFMAVGAKRRIHPRVSRASAAQLCVAQWLCGWVSGQNSKPKALIFRANGAANSYLLKG